MSTKTHSKIDLGVDYKALIEYIQGHFTDGLVIVAGSGLSAAEGVPGMHALAGHLSSKAHYLSGEDSVLWDLIQAELDKNAGLESALLKHAPSQSLEEWIVCETCTFLIPKERDVMTSVISGRHTLRMTRLLSHVLKPTAGIPILTPNYDRLIELACEMAQYHVDTTAIGQYAGSFDHERSCMGSCKQIVTRAKRPLLEHYPRAIVLKPHGSFDWYKLGGTPRRCSLDLDADRLVITPGLNKYRAGYESPFDKHRDLANDHINRASRLFVVGYGFNDDHLQTHLVRRIRDGTPTLILTLEATQVAIGLAQEAPTCVCVSKAGTGDGITVHAQGVCFEHKGANLWDLGILVEELLA